ncbi:hypothetical protein MMC20_004069 [Loxospora ochrophaea]|nr:hypothetical protein [Loxospora ochrophaea]
MALWRDRGFVVDSDDEEDVRPENVENSTPTIIDDGFHTIDDFWDELGAERSPSAEEAKTVLPLSATSVGRNGLKKASETAVQSGSDVVKYGGQETSENGRRQFLGRGDSLSENDIDELQDENLDTSRASRLETNAPTQATPIYNPLQLTPRNRSLSPLPDSLTSSPLTELLSPSPVTSQQHCLLPRAESSETSKHPDLSLSASQQQRDHDESRIPSQSKDQNDTARSIRTFRQRNPNQLHPYTVEGERYRMTLKARGLKPLRIAQESAEDSPLEDRSSQTREFSPEGDSQLHGSVVAPQDVISSSPSYMQPSSPIQSRQNFAQADEDELPDVDTLLRDPIPGVQSLGCKRRKVSHTFSKKSHSFAKSHDRHQSMDLGTTNGSQSHIRKTLDLFDIPPSPPHSGSPTPMRDAATLTEGFRYPRGISPAHLNTPARSSEPRNPPVADIPEDSSSEDRSASGESDATEDDSGSIQPSPQRNQLAHVQRRIRGVLPASWLNLDLKNQGKLPEKKLPNGRSMSPLHMASQRGVAKPIHTSTTKRYDEFSEDLPIELSDTSPVDDQSFVLPLSSQGSPDAHNGKGFIVDDDEAIVLDLDPGDAMEDDRIDAMLPSRRRTSDLSRKNRSRQRGTLRKGQFGKSKATTNDFPNSDPTRFTRQPRITDHMSRQHISKARVQKFRLPPNLSILDALDSLSSRAQIPTFIRIAARVARSRNDKGRHSPSRKFVRLASSHDTIDATESLHAWRTGSIRRSKSTTNRTKRPSHSTRKPLQPLSGNRKALREPTYSLSTASEYGDEQSDNGEHRRRNVSARANKLQRSIENIFQRQQASRSNDPNNTMIRLKSSSTREFRASGKRMQSTLQATKAIRPALLETLQATSNRRSSSATVRRHLPRRNPIEKPSLANPVLERFLVDNSSNLLDTKQVKHSVETWRSVSPQPIRSPLSALPRRARKRPPLRINTRSSPFRELPITIDESGSYTTIQSPDGSLDHPVLNGLGPFGTQYTMTFGIEPLPSGSHFRENTLLGSGSFAKSIGLLSRRDLLIPSEPLLVVFDSVVLRWGLWNDTVSSQLGMAFDRIGQDLRSLRSQTTTNSDRVRNLKCTADLQHSIIRFVNDHLSFVDLVDKESFLSRCKELVESLLSDITEVGQKNDSEKVLHSSATDRGFSMQTATFVVVFASQLRQIAINDKLSSPFVVEAETLVFTAARVTLTSSLDNYNSIFLFLEDSYSFHASSSCEDDYWVEGIVVSHHALKQTSKPSSVFWDIAQDAILPSLAQTSASPRALDVQVLDRQWKKLFSLLPLFELSAEGTIKVDRQVKNPVENWTLVKKLVKPVLDVYIANPREQSSTFNDYCRCLFGRCHSLLQKWHWEIQIQENIILMLSDFFARNKLAHLRNEESYGSPRFLEQLDDNPSMDLDRRDRCFHIFLKIVVLGLHSAQKIYSEQRIRGITIRLNPNHDRTFPKEESINQDHLAALRNHHDLLSTVYWAAPVSARPRPYAIRDLVCLGSSHREPCHIHIRTWLNLVRFQLSTAEPVSRLDSFVEWHVDTISQLLLQHRLARVEAESQAKSSRIVVSTEYLESTIEKNQAHIEAILSDSILSLDTAMNLARCNEARCTLLTDSLDQILGLFDSNQPRLNKLVSQALDVIVRFTQKLTSNETGRPQESSEDSQEYGDWSAFDDVSENSTSVAARHLHKISYESMARFLSKLFDTGTADDSIVIKAVSIWSSMAHVFVSHGIQSWDAYIGYGHNTWSSLRETEQKQRFYPYYLASLIEENPEVFRGNKAFFTSSWIMSIAQPDSPLGFQHIFTSMLLNAYSDSPLLTNLPFRVNPDSKMANITLNEFREARLSLISCLLSNMRESLNFNAYYSLQSATTLKSEYVRFLKHLMTTMKSNYQELDTLPENRKRYVDFVQHVVGFMQQHTANICPVDRFFIDSAAFPLPAHDPSYVVGRLKNYGLQLHDPKSLKPLAVFLQTVSERAAIDAQQSYLETQLHDAIANEFESGDSERPTLRSFLVQAIFPAYFELAFSTTTGWLLALPILGALERVFSGLLQTLDGFDPSSVAATSLTMSEFLTCLQTSMEGLMNRLECVGRPCILTLLTAGFAAITASLPILDYTARLRGPQSYTKMISFFRFFATTVAAQLLGVARPLAPEFGEAATAITLNRHDHIRKFVYRELQETLNTKWLWQDEKYYHLAKGIKSEVNVAIGSIEEEKNNFIAQVERFLALSGEGQDGLPQIQQASDMSDMVF